MNNGDQASSKPPQRMTEIEKRMLEKSTCECGGRFTYRNKAAHKKSARHKRHVATKSVEDAEVEKNNPAIQKDVDAFFKIDAQANIEESEHAQTEKDIAAKKKVATEADRKKRTAATAKNQPPEGTLS